jgi:hypothetical protein
MFWVFLQIRGFLMEIDKLKIVIAKYDCLKNSCKVIHEEIKEEDDIQEIDRIAIGNGLKALGTRWSKHPHDEKSFTKLLVRILKWGDDDYIAVNEYVDKIPDSAARKIAKMFIGLFDKETVKYFINGYMNNYHSMSFDVIDNEDEYPVWAFVAKDKTSIGIIVLVQKA